MGKFYDLFYPNFNFAHKNDAEPMKTDFEEHFHKIYEMLLFIRGDAEFIIENQKFSLVPNSFLFIPPGQHHCITNINPSIPYERYVIKFPEYEIPKPLLPLVQNKFGCFKSEGTPIPDLFARLDYHATHYQGVDKCGLLSCVFKEILYYSCNDTEPHNSEIYNEQMKEVLNYIHENIATRLTLNDICKRFYYSKSYICEEFQRCMGVPIMSYIRTKKVMMAESLINNGAKPIEIFEQCGFSDYSTFFRAYKKLLGKAPSAKQ